MLINHCYVDIRDKWDTGDRPKDNILECCLQDPDDPTCSDCCYDTWQGQLKKVKQSYNQVNEETDQLKKKLWFLTDRRDRYKTWIIELDKAQDKAQLICQQLEIIASQLNKLWYSSCKTVKAIQILFCMIRDFYIQLDQIKIRYDDLQDCLNKNNDPSLQPGQGIRKYLEEYRNKLEAILKTREDILKAVVEAIKLSNLIRNNISTRQCPPKDYDPCKVEEPLCPVCDENTEEKDRYYGFKTVICEWHNYFHCEVKCIEPDPCPPSEPPTQQEPPKSQDQRRAYANQGNSPQPGPNQSDQLNCDEPVICELEPFFVFPICNDDYRKNIEKWIKWDEKCVKIFSDQLKEKLKEKESLEACKDSLEKAIKEVDPRERCK
jgi:hypothetical protein